MPVSMPEPDRDILARRERIVDELAKNPATLARMEVMLDTGKPLRN